MWYRLVLVDMALSAQLSPQEPEVLWLKQQSIDKLVQAMATLVL